MADPADELSGINVTLAPASAQPGELVIVCWELQGHGTASHTDVHWDTQSHPTADRDSVYTGGFAYPGNESTQDPDGYDVPQHYCATIPMGNETIYWRAHAVVFDAPGLLSEEHAIVATQ